ncbi:Predicted arabinose efflux permease, MFS family [Halorientalis persicus]|uniref:Predicted arabinose efflux permease, MFS family n=1 Tax=Halorientalis persicus TaxID=1367881 RepID=A0A1H8W5T4_9EURY|nr:MFS transporter [Halorientalis persicus]SEP22893.1 Predicted arabinose efflux permease, MFS family [Halorientalis persicus]
MSEDAGGALGLLKNAEFRALASTAFARSQAYSTIIIALALYADLFSTSGFVEGLFGTVFAFTQLLIVLPLGRYVDTNNAKRILLLGLGINVVTFVGFTLVSAVEHVLLVRILQGLGASILWITGTTVVGEIGPEDARGRWLGAYNQVGAFSSLAGDVVGGLLLTLYGFTLTYAVLSGVTLLSGLLVYRHLRDDPGGQADPDDQGSVETFRLLLDRTTVRALVIFRLGLSFGKMAVLIFLPIYARTGFGMSALFVGGILAGGKLTKALTQGYVGTLTDRIGRKHQFVFVGAMLYALGTALIPLAEFAVGLIPATTVPVPGMGAVTLSPAFLPLFLAFGVCGVADSIRLPASMALFVEEGEQFDAVAGSMSLRSIAWKVGQVVGPVTVGTLWDYTDVFVAFWTASGLIAVATLAFAILYRVDAADGVETTTAD